MPMASQALLMMPLRLSIQLQQRDEFAWVDSAYPVTLHTIPVHKRPAALLADNTTFDSAVANLRVQSEHCMGALKGWWQCLQGLQVNINSKRQHRAACHWITIAIILHNLVIDVDGMVMGTQFEDVDWGPQDPPLDNNMVNGEAKRRALVEELLAFQQM
ncbi:hypothetical protein OG21DRAFT_1478432 [Imleria badia]|nr:hypothetical protein OG21DRAFT_1478432 [Imleria badia]